MFQTVTIKPIVADLPVEILAYQSPPVTRIGFDYFYSFYVTVFRTAEKKGWELLVTCLTTRAVHLEIVPFMETNSFVIKIERFDSRRCTPAMIWSNNGTNFVGAEKSSARVLKDETVSEYPQNLPTKASSRGSAHPMHLGEASRFK